MSITTREIKFFERDLYTIKEVQWNITSDIISYVSINTKTRKHSIHLKDNLTYQDGIELNTRIFEKFKEQFPEHCLSIVQYEPEDEIPF